MVPARPGWDEKILNSLFFVLGNFLAIYISVTIARIAMRGRETWRLVLASLSGFAVVVWTTVFILGALGMLTVDSIVLFLGFVAVFLFLIQKFKAREESYALPSRDFEVSEGIVENVSIAFLALLLGLFIVRTCLSGTSFTFDDLAYHAPTALHWLLNKRLSLAPVGYQAYFPLNGEVLSLWFMLSSGRDALVSLCGFYWGLTAVAAVAFLCMAQGVGPSISCLVAGSLLVSPTVLRAAETFSAVDLAGPAMMLASVALSLPSPDYSQRKARMVDATYCGLLSGFAAGCKPSFIITPVILLLWIRFGRRHHPASAGEGVLFTLAALTQGAYWYGRNIFLTGNPFFPAQVGPFAGPFGVLQQSHTKLISWISADPLNVGQWKFIIKGYLENGPYGLGILAIIGYGVAFYLVCRRKSFPGEECSPRLVLLIMGSAILLLYPLMPFSATINRPDAPLWVFPRYLIAPFAIGLILFSPLIDEKCSWKKLWRLLFVLAAASALYSYLSSNWDNRALIFAGVIGCVWKYFRGGGRCRRIGWALILGIVLFSLVLWMPYAQQLTDAKVYDFKKNNSCLSIGRAWRFMEENLPDKARVTGLGAARWLSYPLYGRRFQFIYRYSRRSMHEYWRREGTFWDHWDKDDKYDLPLFSLPRPNRSSSYFLSELVAAEVDYVLVAKVLYDKWPPEHKLLASSDRVEEVYKDDCSAIWKIIRK